MTGIWGVVFLEGLKKPSISANCLFLYGQGGSIPAAPQQVTIHWIATLLLYYANVIHKNVIDEMKIDITVKYGRWQ